MGLSEDCVDLDGVDGELLIRTAVSSKSARTR
jgi:hypothetical protein